MRPIIFNNHPYRSSRNRGNSWIPLLLLSAGLLMAPALVSVSSLQAQERESVEVTYQRARDLNLRGEWEQASELFRQIASGDSPRAPEAAFYLALCLENLPGKDEEAFQIYDALRQSHPDHTVAQKGLSHQIILAGVLGESDRSYREFLAKLLESDDPGIRMEAALSLARFGDERAVDSIEEILREGSPDQQMMALERVPNFESDTAERLARDAARKSTDPGVQAQAANLEETLKTTADERRRMETMLARDKRLLMETIKRQGETWTDEELLIHFLFHTMPRRTFLTYVQGNEAERQRIYDDFLSDLDRRNRGMSRQEIETEIQRRIEHAVAEYSDPWRATRSQFDAKEWMTPGNPYAPWDARGELYVRYGEPTDIFMIGNNIVEWYYANLRVDFTVHEYKLNFMLNAIYPGRASQQDYPVGQVQANYINTPRIEF